MLPSGKLLVGFNNDFAMRYPLSVAVSSDLGQTFEHVRDLVGSLVMHNVVGRLYGEHSYPTMLLTPCGKFVDCAWTHCRETIAHQRCAIDWLLGGDGTSGGVFQSPKSKSS